MVFSRLIFFLLFLLGGFWQSSAQKNPVFYAGFEYYRDTELESNAFVNLNIGSQLFHWKFFAPEIGYDYYFGSLRDDDIYEKVAQGRIHKGIFESDFYASLFTLNPKLKIGKKDAFISFSPKYHIGKIYAKGNFYGLKENANHFSLQESQKRSSAVHFWSFSIAFEGLALTGSSWFSISLNYTEMNANDAYSFLNFSGQDVNIPSINTKTIGLGLRFYYNPFSKEGD